MMNIPEIIIYHGGCPDGFSAAWCFHWYIRELTLSPLNDIMSTHTDYLPYRYGQTPPDVKGKVVAIVDFSFPYDVIVKMLEDAKFLMMFDHHASAQRDLERVILGKKGTIIFDMKRCGAEITWDFLFPGRPRPWFINYVADRDLWKHALPHTEAISEYLYFYDYFQSFDKLDYLYKLGVSSDLGGIYENAIFDGMVRCGSILLDVKKKKIEQYVSNAKLATFNTATTVFTARITCAPREYRSDVGNEICKKYTDCDFAAIYWYDFSSDEWWVSLRSSSECKYDLSEITSKFQKGGGHKNAAGFTISGKEHLRDYFRLL